MSGELGGKLGDERGDDGSFIAQFHFGSLVPGQKQVLEPDL